MTSEQAFTNLYNVVSNLKLTGPEHFQLKALFEEAGKVIFKPVPQEQPAAEG